MRETRNVENRMMGVGQSVQREHTEHRGERCPQNGQLKGDGNKGRPAIERAAANVQRVGDRRSPVLKPKSSDAPGQAAEKRNGRHQIAFQAEGVRKTFDREGGIGIQAAVTRLADFFDRLKEFFRSAELAHYAV